MKLETLENEELIEKVMEDLNSGKQQFDFVRIEKVDWEDNGDLHIKIVVENIKRWFVDATLRKNNEIEVGDLEEYSLENDMWG